MFCPTPSRLSSSPLRHRQLLCNSRNGSHSIPRPISSKLHRFPHFSIHSCSSSPKHRLSSRKSRCGILPRTPRGAGRTQRRRSTKTGLFLPILPSPTLTTLLTIRSGPFQMYLQCQHPMYLSMAWWTRAGSCTVSKGHQVSRRSRPRMPSTVYFLKT